MASILCKGGTLWDGEHFFKADLLCKDGVIQTIAPQIEDADAVVYDATACIVSAGLVDLHTHFRGISCSAFGFPADLATLPFGVTFAVDASGGWGSRALLDSFLVKNRVFVSVDIRDNRASFDNTERLMALYGDKTIGVKVYFDTTVSEVRDLAPLQQTVDFATRHGLKVMVHSSNAPVSMADLLATLRAGDVFTHAYHGGQNNVSEDGFACIREAKARGVVIDAGLAGYVHTDFDVFKNALIRNAAPHVISTDITRVSAYQRGGRYGLPLCMSIARTLGMTEEDVFRAVTSAPAAALGVNAGVLAVGIPADIAVLSWTEEPFSLTDRAGNTVQNTHSYRNRLTLVNGEIVYRD